MRRISEEPMYCDRCGKELRNERDQEVYAPFDPITGKRLRVKFCANAHTTLSWYEEPNGTWIRQ